VNEGPGNVCHLQKIVRDADPFVSVAKLQLDILVFIDVRVLGGELDSPPSVGLNQVQYGNSCR
jgi:hypothetical protein